MTAEWNQWSFTCLRQSSYLPDSQQKSRKYMLGLSVCAKQWHHCCASAVSVPGDQRVWADESLEIKWWFASFLNSMSVKYGFVAIFFCNTPRLFFLLMVLFRQNATRNVFLMTFPLSQYKRLMRLKNSWNLIRKSE